MNVIQELGLKEQLTHQHEIAYAVETISQVLQHMFAARPSQECPNWMESDYIVGGLIAGIAELNEMTLTHTHQLAKLLDVEINR